MIRRRGSILIIVLFVMTVLSLAGVSFTYRAGLASRLANNAAVMARLRAHSASVVAIVAARLSAEENRFDHPAEPWCAHLPLAKENWLEDWSPAEPGREAPFLTEYAVIDELGKLNALYASSQALEKLEMSPEQIASLLDWMDQDDIAQAEGAESRHYLGKTPPHRCKNAPIETLEELFLIKGFGPGEFYGEDANHNGMLDAGEDDGPASYPPDDADGKLRPGWVQLLTCQGDGRININTAPGAVLAALPISQEAVGQIIAYRRFDADSHGNLEDHAFGSAEDINRLQGLTDADRLALNHIARFRSNCYRLFVRSTHRPTGLSHELEVLLRFGQAGPEVVLWKQRPYGRVSPDLP